MSDDRETPASRAAEAPETSANPGAPVEEAEASQTDVLAAVQRSRSTSSDSDAGSEREVVAAEEIVVVDAEEASPVDEAEAERARREAASEVDTQLDLETLGVGRPSEPAESEVSSLPALDDLPSASAEAPLPPARDGEIRISADHPMAALYMQTPMPPDIRGNRGAGLLISVLATVGFALVYAGVYALVLAPSLAPSQFVDGLTEQLLRWSTAAAVAAFFVSLSVLVLIVGRAGWWAYVLGGFLVAGAVWVATTIGVMTDVSGFGALFHLPPLVIAERFGLTVPAVVAALVAREVTIWFGAWIGGRGRRMKQKNAEALAEYEAALAESQEKHSASQQAFGASTSDQAGKRATQP